MLKVLLTDDHTIITDGIANLLNEEADIQIVGVCRNGKEAIDFIHKNEVDLLLLDVDMPVMNGLECAEKCKVEFPQLKIAMLTMHHEKAMIKRFIELGTKGYFLKTISQDELLLAIRRIGEGGEYFPSDVTKSLLKSEDAENTQSVELNPLLETLTHREREIISCISQGMSNKEIGEVLFISPRTVDTHRTNIMKKIEVNNVAGVIRFAFKNGLAK